MKRQVGYALYPPFRLSLLIWLAAFGAIASAAERPNILWITSEDHGPHMGCYGDQLARTPNIDALAARGMCFRRAWSCAPVCAPARTMIVTGLYASSSGGLHMRSMVSLPPEMKLLPQYLQQAGYYCTNNVKEDYNVRLPQPIWNESSGKAHWRNRNSGQPFFAVFNSMKSHESQVRLRPHNQITDPAKVRVPAYHPDTPEIRQDWAQYYDQVSEADADAGAHLKEIDAAGLADDTIVFYFADHGSGMPRSKRWPSDSGLHVPLVVYFPEKWRHLAPSEYQPNGQSDRLVSFVDMAPTVLSIVGIAPPDWMQGHAFAGPRQSQPPQFVFGERGRMDESFDLVRSVTDGRYVYLRNFFPHVSQGQHVSYQFETPTTRVWRALYDQGKTNESQSLFWRVPKAPEELYDLQSDPDEVHNLALSSQHRSLLENFRRIQHEHAFSIRDVCLLPEGEMHARSEGSTPYEMARNETKYPMERTLSVAELATDLRPDATPKLIGFLNDGDNAVRYWAALGLLMRGREAVNSGIVPLRRAMNDDSKYVRVIAAQALLQFGPESESRDALKTLGELTPPQTNGVLISMWALTTIDALGDKAASLHELVRTMNPKGPSPDARFDDYVHRLVKRISKH